MKPVIQQLTEDYKQSFVATKTSGNDNQEHWIFQGELEKFSDAFYEKIVPNHLLLSLEYTLVRQHINARRANLSLDKEQLEEALILNELLERVYSLYLNVPREVKRLRIEHEVLKRLLQNNYALSNKVILFQGIPAKVDVGYSFAHQLRKWNPVVNLVRLLTNRGIRLLDVTAAIAALASKAKNYQHFVLLIDTHLRPLMPYVACIFFLPRLLMNLFMLLKHTIRGSWMHEKEQNLLWTTRLKTHFSRRWFDVSNDTAWLFASIINCFVLVGALSPMGIYVSITFFSYDVFLSAIRTYRELSVLNELEAKYTKMLDGKTDPVIEGYITQIRKHREYDQLRLGFHVLSTISVVLATSCALTLFAGCPVIPLVGALWLVMVCVLNIKINACIDKWVKPDDVIVDLDNDKKQVTTSLVGKQGIFNNKKVVELNTLSSLQKETKAVQFCSTSLTLFNDGDNKKFKRNESSNSINSSASNSSIDLERLSDDGYVGPGNGT